MFSKLLFSIKIKLTTVFYHIKNTFKMNLNKCYQSKQLAINKIGHYILTLIYTNISLNFY